jgi:MYXO-CTERM domain-containing protein
MRIAKRGHPARRQALRPGRRGSATLFGTTIGLSEHIPMQAATHQGEFAVTVTLPTTITPGSYSPSIDCDNGVSGVAQFTVNPVPGQGAKTGDGTTSTATDTTLTGAGLGVAGLGAALVGGLALRRRRRGPAS